MKQGSETTHLAALQSFSAALHHCLDQVQALAADFHAEIDRLTAAGLVHDRFLCGDAIFAEPFEPASDADSGWVYQATLSIPGGFGAARWESEEFLLAQRDGHGLEALADDRNVLLENLPPRVQARLLSQIHPLLDRWLVEIGAKKRERPRSE